VNLPPNGGSSLSLKGTPASFLLLRNDMDAAEYKHVVPGLIFSTS
jgi:hypothetical protein